MPIGHFLDIFQEIVCNFYVCVCDGEYKPGWIRNTVIQRNHICFLFLKDDDVILFNLFQLNLEQRPNYEDNFSDFSLEVNVLHLFFQNKCATGMYTNCQF